MLKNYNGVSLEYGISLKLFEHPIWQDSDIDVAQFFKQSPGLREPKVVPRITQLWQLVAIIGDRPALDKFREGFNSNRENYEGIHGFVVYAAHAGNALAMRATVSLGLPSNTLDGWGRNAWHIAIQFKNMDCIRAATAIGVNHEKADRKGHTPEYYLLHSQYSVKYTQQEKHSVLLHFSTLDILASQKHLPGQGLSPEIQGHTTVPLVVRKIPEVGTKRKRKDDQQPERRVRQAVPRGDSDQPVMGRPAENLRFFQGNNGLLTSEVLEVVAALGSLESTSAANPADEEKPYAPAPGKGGL